MSNVKFQTNKLAGRDNYSLKSVCKVFYRLYWIRILDTSNFDDQISLFFIHNFFDTHSRISINHAGLRDSVVNRMRRVGTQPELYTRTFPNGCMFLFTLKQRRKPISKRIQVLWL